jgi:hypothetical protein
MNRRAFITGLGAMLAAPLVGEAQEMRKPPRLCFLTFDPGTTQSNRFNPFFQRLRDLGYVDGQTISIDYLSADGRGERFPALAAECLQFKPDIIVVTTTPAAQSAKNATHTIPIVMIPLGDPRCRRLGRIPRWRSLWWQPVLDAIRELGYIEGQNLAVKRAFAKGHAEHLRRLVAEMTRSGIDVAVTSATRETQATIRSSRVL